MNSKLKVDYQGVAARYDRNSIRSEVPRDEVILSLLSSEPSLRVLDVGCGTGTYLATQIKHFSSPRIQWFGVDPSSEMLRIAKSKAQVCDLRIGFAEQLPYEAGYFNYIVSRFSFQHFTDKDRALQEIVRTLADGGCCRIENITPELSPHWWIYRFFPSAVEIDQSRFWPTDSIKKKLKQFGFEVSVKTRLCGLVGKDAILTEARNRETSELLLIGNDEYRFGLRKLEDFLADCNSDKVESGLTISEIVCKKLGVNCNHHVDGQ